LIVGILAFILQFARNLRTGSANHFRGFPPHRAALRKINRAKRNRANRPSLSGKRFDTTEDRSYDRSAFAVQSVTEVMHPSSISRGRAQEN
jgi:hypothetical protein